MNMLHCMRKVFLTAISTLSLFPVMAQQSMTGYCFKEFTSGRVVLKNRQFAKGKFNYDGVKREMHFLNGGADMVVENLADIDTVVIASRCFVPYEDRFCEVLRGEKFVLFVDWKMKVKEMGKKGAMGTTTQGSVQAIDVNTRFQRVNGEQNLDLSVYRMETENVYHVWIKDKRKSFRNVKTFLGLFPKERQQEVKEYMETNKVDMDQPERLLNVLDTCL